MQHSSDRILTTHVGSLIRPPALVGILKAIDAGESVSDGALGECLQNAVAEVVRQQADLGLDLIN
ncbi:MAG: epoxyalkane--coenzyme M transferase, partial [Steroidobacterales bacterium]